MLREVYTRKGSRRSGAARGEERRALLQRSQLAFPQLDDFSRVGSSSEAVPGEGEIRAREEERERERERECEREKTKKLQEQEREESSLTCARRGWGCARE